MDSPIRPDLFTPAHGVNGRKVGCVTGAENEIIDLFSLPHQRGTTVKGHKFIHLKRIALLLPLLASSIPVWGADRYRDIPVSARNYPVAAGLKIKKAKDVNVLRQNLITFLWKGKGFPNRIQPRKVEKYVPNPIPGLTLTNLQSVDRITVQMDQGFESIIYRFRPQKDNDKFVIWHQGHTGDLWAQGGRDVVSTLVQRGYNVFAMGMPLYGENQNRLARRGVNDHEYLRQLINPEFQPIKLFVEPVIAVVNHIERYYGRSQVAMIGLSGGGWTTQLSAALDPRILQSFPVAASQPFYLNPNYNFEAGTLRQEFEQTYAPLYNIADYTDLYLMGAYGEKRSQLQVLNQFDSCCFEGVGYLTYEPVLRERLEQIGPGRFSVFLDSSHTSHQVSAYALRNAILPRLEEAAR